MKPGLMVAAMVVQFLWDVMVVATITISQVMVLSDLLILIFHRHHRFSVTEVILLSQKPILFIMNHCCGCPNHSCNKKEDKHVKIEEHEPEVKNKSNHSLVPVEFKNYPYPIVWIPPEDMKNREQRDSTAPKLKHGDEYPPDMRAHENLEHLEHEPNVRSGWFPFDINNMGSLKHGGDRNKVQDQPNGDRNRAQDQPNVDKNQFQFPIFWLPYKHEEDETRGDKEAKADHKSAERSSPNLKVASAQLPSNKVGLKATENNVNGKTNDVKQQEELHNTGKTEEGEGKARGITVKEIEHSGDKKPSDDGTKRQAPSPQKMSKLPLVCLRVDPLPKRKNSHGDSRSPSPSHKEKAQEAFGDRSESTSSIKESEEVEPNKGKIKVVKVVDGITKQDTGEDCKAQTPIGAPVNLFPKSGEDVSTNQDTSKVVVCDDVREGKEVKAPDATVESHLGDGELQTEDDEGANKAENEIPKEEDRANRKNLSEAEATVIIQSAYHGFEVRKWEPLKKLKQIAEVREHAAQIRSRIESLESSFDIRSDDKQKLIIGETIMSLLLKLDTIQGLHPTVRNFRKSVAKELVSLQEKLDSLPTNKSEVSNVKLVEDLSMNAKGDSSFEETGNGNSFAEIQSNHSNISDLVEPSQCQISNITEATSGSQIMETSEMKLVKKEACEESEDKIIASPLQSSRELVDKLKDDLNNEVIDDGEMMMLKAQTDGSELKLLVEPMPSAAEENVDSAVVGTMPSCLGDQSAASPEFNQELVIEQSPRHELIEIGNCEVLQSKGEVESQSAIGITTSIAEANQVQQTLDALNDASIIVDLKHEIGEESDFEGHEDVMAEQEEAQKKVGHINENVKISRADDEIGLGNAPIEDARLKIEEFTVQKHGEEKNNTNELLDTSEPEKPQPQLAFAEDEIHDGEACKPEEPHAEFSPLENETHCGVASKTEETWPGLSPALGQENDDSGITNDEDNCSRQDIKETKECNEESENQEILCGSETTKEALIATQFVPADAEELPQVEGELFPMSPNYSQVYLGSKMGSESDEKLVEENKKLREIMEKLIETGTEQLTAISNLSSKVKDLEKKLARKKKSRTRRSELELPVLNMQMML
ncbi:unnamed protein product [Camellia sinensis]